MSDLPPGVRGWTRHGHAIKGMVQVAPRPAIARCGGPGICSPCSVDAARQPSPAEHTVNVVRRDPGCECDLKTLDGFGCTEGCECYKCRLEAENAWLREAVAQAEGEIAYLKDHLATWGVHVPPYEDESA